jgi:hypothetical protein
MTGWAKTLASTLPLAGSGTAELRPYTTKDKKQTDERQGGHCGQDNCPGES